MESQIINEVLKDIDDLNIDADEFIPAAAMPNDRLPEYSLQLNKVEYIVRVTCLQSPSYFFIKLLKDDEVYEKFWKNINGHYNKPELKSISCVLELPIGSHWCVLFQREWLRAKVISNLGMEYTKKRQAKFEMFFVDYGFKDIVYLENVYTLEKEFLLDPPFAIPCCLAQVFPTSEWCSNPWSDDVIDLFYKYAVDTEECRATVLEYNLSKIYEIVLELNDGKVLNEELVALGLAKSSNIEKILSGHSGPLPAIIEENNLQDIWDPMKADYLDENNTIFLDDNCAETVLLGIQNKDETNLCKFFRKGVPCPRGNSCHWPHFRSTNDGLPTDIEIVYSEMESELCLPEVGCLIHDQAIVTEIVSPDDFYINISCPGFDKTLDLMSELQRDLSEVYCGSAHLHGSALPSLGELMVVHNTEGPRMGYYRVRILEVIEKENYNSIKIHYIDLGAVESVKENSLRKFTAQFLRPPAQAVGCYLDNVAPVGEEWEDAATIILREATENRYLTILPTYFDENEVKLGLIIVDPKNEEKTLNELLVSEGVGILLPTEE